MSEINTFIKSAMEMGYAKENALDWGTKMYKEFVAREERAMDRNLRQSQLNAEQKEKERTHQLLLEQSDKERRQDALEMEDRKIKERELEIEKLKLQKEIKESGDGVTSDSNPASCNTINSTLKFPLFRDGEDMAAFILRFERICKRTAVHKDLWATHLGCLLTGKALKVYCTVPDTIASSYEQLKEALLKGFAKTPDALRTDFKSAKLASDETHVQFFDSLSRLLYLWLKSSEVDLDDAHSLTDFMLRDQFLASISPELRTYLKERKFDSTEDMVEAADLWTSAHKYKSGAKRSEGNMTKPLFKVDKSSTQNEVTKIDKGSNDKPYKGKNWSGVRCYNCGEQGHPAYRCPHPKKVKVENTNFVSSDIQSICVNCNLDSLTCKCKILIQSDKCINVSCMLGETNMSTTPSKYLSSGSINGMPVTSILRDTGCSAVLVSEQCLPFLDPDNCEKVKVSDYLGRVSFFPKVRCYLKCSFYEGFVEAIRAPLSHCSILVGNIPGVKDDIGNNSQLINESDFNDNVNTINKTCAVVTRSQDKRPAIHPLKVPKLDIVNLTPSEFSDLQSKCPSLSSVRDKLKDGAISNVGGRKFKFRKINNLIYNVCISSPKINENGRTTLVVPYECRMTVLKTAHENLLSGHFSARKTELKIKDQFYWPSMGRDIKIFCRSCDLCQRFSKKGSVKRAPMEKMPIITEPFMRVSIDLIGPLTPSSDRGYKYVLTLIDVATSFPEAVPLKNIDTVTVSEALLQIFGRVGIPKQIHSDLGTQFVSNLMKEIHRLLGIQPLFNTPYHPQGTGRIERLNGTLKSVLKKLCNQKPKDWDRYLIPTLFALRELPSDRTGYSSFELLYGRQVRGPLAVLRDIWEDPELKSDDRETFQYVLDLKRILEDSASLAASAADISATRYKTYFDLKSQKRSFCPGDEVLVLLPDSTHKLLMGWRGPFKVLEKRNNVDYVIDEAGKRRLYHINLLKKYYRRSDQLLSQTDFPEPDYEATVCSISTCQYVVLEDDDKDSFDPEIVTIDPNINLDLKDVHICENLHDSQRKIITDLLNNFKDVISTLPGRTDAIEHNIKLLDNKPVRSKMYPVPLHLRDVFDKEVDSLLDLGVIRPSSSPYCSPGILIKKQSGDYRLAIDYRNLNSVTQFDAEPACNLEEELHRFSGCKYFSEFDLTKAYYQIPMAADSIKYTAFGTPKGLMEFCRLPFGLSTACASYIRLMRKVLDGLDISFYFDNILIYSKNFESHVVMIERVLNRLRSFGLTVKPSKMSICVPSIKYLGFVINGDYIAPQAENVKKVTDFKIPTNKTTLRSFIGLCSFYSKFIQNFATLTAPLTDLLKKGTPEPIPWNSNCDHSFGQLKQCLCKDPILKLPQMNLPFVLRTDASNVGIGAVLFQYHNNEPFPVGFASKKLLDRETRYSTVEKELLAVVFGISKFKYYLMGQKFLLEVDHQPLVYLQKFKSHNNRLLRWALGLQAYDFQVVHVRGIDNLGADFLSRAI